VIELTTHELELMRPCSRPVFDPPRDLSSATATAEASRQLVHRSLARMSNKLAYKVLTAWRSWAVHEMHVAELLRTCALRFSHRIQCMVWGAWTEHVRSRLRTRVISARFTSDKRIGLLANGLMQWARRVAEAQAFEEQVRWLDLTWLDLT
jgi:hypothetical protein